MGFFNTMPARIGRAGSVENLSTTLNGSISAGALTITVASSTNFLPGSYAVIDRIDGTGTRKATSLWEYVYISGISGNDLTVVRGQGGSTGQTHDSSSVIEAISTASLWEDFYAGYVLEHTIVPGGHVSLASLSYLRSIGLVVSSVASVAQLVTSSLGLDSSASVLFGSFQRLFTSSVASIATGFFGVRADVSGASITGLPRTLVWYMPGFASAATSNVMRLITPFGGTFQSFTATVRTPVSTASLTLAIYNIRSGASIFNLIGRPAILGGGTFVSTASILTPNFTSGDVLRADIETGGNVSDITLEGIAY